MTFEQLELYCVTGMTSLPWIVIIGVLIRGGKITVQFGKGDEKDD